MGVGRLLAWKDVFGDTSGQGRGRSTPLPVEPLPQGGDSPIDTVPCRRQALIGLTENSMKSRFLPVHGYPDYRHALPAPGKGAGGGRGSGRAVGVGRLLAWKDVFGDTSGQGRGMFHPPLRQPLPQGGDSPSIRCPVGGRLLSVSPKTP